MNDNELQPIFKGKISKWGDERDDFGAPTTASVVPITAQDAPTRLFAINYTCRDPRCNLQIGDTVWCARAEDGDGIILARADGNNTQHFPGNVFFEKGALPNGDVNVEENVNVDKDVTAKQTVTGEVDVIGGGISLKGHTHTGVHGETSAPH